jgi:hypothetical protein
MYRVKDGRCTVDGVEVQLTRNDAGTAHRHHVHGGYTSFDRSEYTLFGQLNIVFDTPYLVSDTPRDAFLSPHLRTNSGPWPTPRVHLQSPNLRTPNPGVHPSFYITNARVNPGLNPGIGVLRRGLSTVYWQGGSTTPTHTWLEDNVNPVTCTVSDTLFRAYFGVVSGVLRCGLCLESHSWRTPLEVPSWVSSQMKPSLCYPFIENVIHTFDIGSTGALHWQKAAWCSPSCRQMALR